MTTVKLTLTDIALLSLLRQGGANGYVDIEHVAVDASMLAPSDFRLRHYPDHPDVDAVRRALARRPDIVLTGDGGRTRMLTPQGLADARRAEAAMNEPEARAGTTRRSAPASVQRLLRHAARRRWSDLGIAGLDREDVVDLLLGSPGDSVDLLRQRAQRARTQAIEWGHEDLAKMLSEIETVLAQLFAREGP